MKLLLVGVVLGVVAGGARAGPTALLRVEDYPREAIKRHEEGTVQARLRVSSEGRVIGCAIVRSASPSLDAATCRIITQRARFVPTKGGDGTPIESDFLAPPIRWVLPAAPPPPPPTPPTKHDERGIR